MSATPALLIAGTTHAVIMAHPHVLRAVVRAAVRPVARAVASACSAVAARLRRRPVVSVVTPTWKRRDLLLSRCIPSVAAQTYDGPVEHVIVSDGPDPGLDGVPGVHFLPEHVPAANRGIWARLHGTRLASGDLIAYLDDDNSWRPAHLELLVTAITELDVSFAYSRAQCRNEYGVTWVVGCPKPVFTQIDTSLIVHRAGLLEAATWRPSGQPADWDIVERWLTAGARWAFVPEITLDYYARSVPVMLA